eukprot:379496-Alexandrium_andersonii.AAC.1
MAEQLPGLSQQHWVPSGASWASGGSAYAEPRVRASPRTAVTGGPGGTRGGNREATGTVRTGMEIDR